MSEVTDTTWKILAQRGNQTIRIRPMDAATVTIKNQPQPEPHKMTYLEFRAFRDAQKNGRTR